MEKLDYKKMYKNLYLPKTSPEIIEVPAIPFVMLDGQGDPNGEEFATATEALYSFSYSVKMSYKRDDIPKGYFDYTVFPMEGVWDLVDKSLSARDKSNYAYTIMIRQPEFLTEELFHRFLQETKVKKQNPFLDKLVFTTLEEGLCCQMLHVGSYDDEPASFEKMETYCRDKGYTRTCKTHREIYLSDPRRVEPEKVKTVLRFQVEKLK